MTIFYIFLFFSIVAVLAMLWTDYIEKRYEKSER